MTLSGKDHGTTAMRDDSGVDAKSFEIPKRLIWEAWKRVAANQGGPGVDRESIETFRNRSARNQYAGSRFNRRRHSPSGMVETHPKKPESRRILSFHTTPAGCRHADDRIGREFFTMKGSPSVTAVPRE